MMPEGDKMIDEVKDVPQFPCNYCGGKLIVMPDGSQYIDNSIHIEGCILYSEPVFTLKEVNARILRNRVMLASTIEQTMCCGAGYDCDPEDNTEKVAHEIIDIIQTVPIGGYNGF